MSGLGEGACNQRFLCGLVGEIVEAVRRNLKVDWTKPHRKNVRADVKVAGRMVLRKKGIKADPFDFILARVMEQAQAICADWPTTG